MNSNHHTDPIFNEKKRPKNPIKFQISLNEEQKQAKQHILENPITVIKGAAGSGKANWVQTPILTPKGPKPMGDIKSGDFVISENGKPIKVLDIFPQGKQDIYEVTFSDGNITHCTLDHLFNVSTKDNFQRKFNRNGNPNKNYQKFLTLSLKQIKENSTDINGNFKSKYFIPTTLPVEFDVNSELELDPYILGCLLGDGGFTEITPTISSVDPEIIEAFESYFKNWDLELKSNGKCTFYISSGKTKKVLYKKQKFESIQELIDYLNISRGTFYKRKNNKDYNITELPNKLTSFLIKEDLQGKNSYNKHIPTQYLYSSIEDRISLLQGLLDTDGWVQNSEFRNQKGHNSSVYFSTTSEQLKNDIIYLVNSLGGICTVFQKQGKYKPPGESQYKITSTNWRIKIIFNNPLIENRLFRLERKQKRVVLSKVNTRRKIVSIEKVFEDDAQCILVDSPTHLYLSDNFVVTHNTLVAAQSALDMLFTKQIEKIIITRPTVSKEEIGFLPGDIREKMDPWLAPIYQNLFKLYNKDKIKKEIEEGNIEILPFAFMRGITFTESFVIVDEAQNVTHSQMEMVIGRLGKNSKMVICGDVSQIDLRYKKESGFAFLQNIEAQVEGFKLVTLKQNHRHSIVQPILDIYLNYRD